MVPTLCVLAAGYLTCTIREEHALRRLQHVLLTSRKPALTAQAVGKDLFSFLSLNAHLPCPQRLAEQRPKSNLKQGFKCDIV